MLWARISCLKKKKKPGTSSHRGRPKNFYSNQEAGVQAASGPETLGLLLSAERRPLCSGVKAQDPGLDRLLPT